MKTKYICEICGNVFDKSDDALTCEKRGIADPSVYPIGLMYPVYMNEEFIGIFAVARHLELPKHYCEWVAYAVRNPRLHIVHGHSLEDTCTGCLVATDTESLKKWLKHHYLAPRDRLRREFRMMVSYLLEMGIIPTYYDEVHKLTYLEDQ